MQIVEMAQKGNGLTTFSSLVLEFKPRFSERTEEFL